MWHFNEHTFFNKWLHEHTTMVLPLATLHVQHPGSSCSKQSRGPSLSKADSAAAKWCWSTVPAHRSKQAGKQRVLESPRQRYTDTKSDCLSCCFLHVASHSDSATHNAFVDIGQSCISHLIRPPTWYTSALEMAF